MANPDPKNILIEATSEYIIKICIRFQADSGLSDSEVKTLLREIARLWGIEEKKYIRVQIINFSYQFNSQINNSIIFEILYWIHI